MLELTIWFTMDVIPFDINLLQINKMENFKKALFDILELHAMKREEIDQIADHFQIDKSQPKQTVIYEILDKQAK